MSDRSPVTAVRWMASFVLLALGLLLASCGTPPQLADVGPGTAPPGKTPPPVAVRLIGIPPDQAKILKDALAVAAGQRDVGIVDGTFQSGTYMLTGNFHATAGTDGTSIDYTWELRDKDGVLVQSIANQETAPGAAAGQEWQAVSPDTLRAIAEATAKAVAAKLSALGFATRTTSLIMPPSYTFVAAGPGAGKDIDLETLNGPSVTAADDSGAPQDQSDAIVAASLSPPGGATEVPSAKTSATAPAGAKVASTEGDQTPPPSGKGRVEIKAVAVLPVKGSPGPGDAELTAAMRRALSAAGWPVIAKPRGDALTIRGTVELAAAQSGRQNVALRWTVETPQGKLLGDVKQANAVPEGSLEEGWGSAADPVAQAAASGIFDLIRRYR
jgi:hypothetical protein